MAELNRQQVIQILAGNGNLSGVDLEGLNLDGLDFSNATLRGTRLNRCSLKNTYWGERPAPHRLLRDERVGRYAGATFDEADVSGAKFRTGPAEGLREIFKRAGASTEKAVFTDGQATREAEQARQRQRLEEYQRTGKLPPDKNAGPRRTSPKPSGAF